MAVRAADPGWQAYVYFESKDRSACGPAIPKLLRQGRNRAFRANLTEQDHVASDDAKPRDNAVAPRRGALGRGAAARSRGGRLVRLFRAHDRDLLPAVVRRALAPARECRVSSNVRRRRTGGISAVQALPPE